MSSKQKIKYVADRLIQTIEFWEKAIETREQRIAMREQWVESADCDPAYWETHSLPPSVRPGDFPALPSEVRHWLKRYRRDELEAIESRVKETLRDAEKVIAQHDPASVKKANRLDRTLLGLFERYVDLLIFTRDALSKELETQSGRPPKGKTAQTRRSKSNKAELRDDRDDALLEKFEPDADQHPTRQELLDWLDREAPKRGWPDLDSQSGITDALKRAWVRRHPNSPDWPFDNRGRRKQKPEKTKKRNSRT